MSSRGARVYVFCILALFIALSTVWYFRGGMPGSGSRAAAGVLECPGCNVIVLVIDTLRADHLQFYGYDTETAPFLGKIATGGAVFERAFSASSWTAPAAASYFTSVLPSQHGVITGFAATRKFQKKDSTIRLNRIPSGLPNLPEIAARAGLTTIGVADNLNIGKEIGFDRGFQFFRKFRSQGAVKINDKVEEFVAEAGSGPYFLYIHYMEPHEPFLRHQPWYGQCVKKREDGPYRDVKCAYDSEIRYLDRQIEKLFTKYNWLENSVVIILSDHGEEFGDHGKQGHGTSLYTELIRVPLVVYHPAWPGGRRVMRNVHTMDILPTLASIVMQPGYPHWRGKSLLPAIHRSEPSVSRPIVSERLRHPNSKHKWSKRSVVVDNFHYIRTDDGPGLAEELYDLDVDFAEKNNLSEQEPVTVAGLSEVLDEEISVELDYESETFEIEADKNLLKELKSLGYLH